MVVRVDLHQDGEQDVRLSGGVLAGDGARELVPHVGSLADALDGLEDGDELLDPCHVGRACGPRGLVRDLDEHAHELASGILQVDRVEVVEQDLSVVLVAGAIERARAVLLVDGLFLGGEEGDERVQEGVHAIAVQSPMHALLLQRVLRRTMDPLFLIFFARAEKEMRRQN